jgi:hypothetical protein
MAALATYSADFDAIDDATLAATAGVETIAVTSFRSGSPHWTLERPGVLLAICNTVGADIRAARASFSAAKTRATTRRGHGSAFSGDFGHTWPSIRS